MRKLTALLLTLTLIFTLFSCTSEKDEGIVGTSNPLGIRFTYPSGWIVTRDEDTLFQIAYQENTSSVLLSSFSVSALPPLADGITLNAYVETDYAESLEKTFTQVSDIKKADIQVGDQTALSCVFTCQGDGRSLRVRQILCNANDSLYAFTYVAAVDYYDSHVTEINDLLKTVKFTKKTAPKAPLKGTTDGAAPGMLLATNDAVYFGLNYPADWELIQNDGLILVKAKDSPASVSVTAVSTVSGIKILSDDVNEFFSRLKLTCKDLAYDKQNDDGTAKGTECKVAGREAASYLYSYTLSDVTFRCRLTAFYDAEGYFHTVVYTASEDDFDIYLPSADVILKNFVLK